MLLNITQDAEAISSQHCRAVAHQSESVDNFTISAVISGELNNRWTHSGPE
jgi:hypothetical protein